MINKGIFFCLGLTIGIIEMSFIWLFIEIAKEQTNKRKQWIKSLDDKTYRKYMEMRGF